MHPHTRLILGLAASWIILGGLGAGGSARAAMVTASSARRDSEASGARDGNRFALGPGQDWRGEPGQGAWWWQIEFLKIEPRPLCAFLSGNFTDWCEVDRRAWRGVEQVLRRKHLPLWASCGGAQGLAILSEYGTRQPWDCPHCRDP